MLSWLLAPRATASDLLSKRLIETEGVRQIDSREESIRPDIHLKKRVELDKRSTSVCSRGLRRPTLAKLCVAISVVALVATFSLLHRQRAPARTIGACSKDTCNLLVVVDMQNDYCTTCGSETVSPWAEPILPTAAKINDIMALKTPKGESIWDLVVFTKDWLEPGVVCLEQKESSCVKSSLVRDTFGTQVVSQIRKPADSAAYLEYTKNLDDWFNTMDANMSADHQDHFALNGENIPGNSHPTLRQMLQYRGFTPEKTRMVVTGTASNRCVMKGSVHARYDGYNVFVVASAIAGYAEKPDNWHPGENAPDTFCGDTQACDGNEARSWEREVFFGEKGGPTRPQAFAIMTGAGVITLPGSEQLATSLYSPLPQKAAIHV